MRHLCLSLHLFVIAMSSSLLQAADWNQWRGPHRNGFVQHAEKLIDNLPATGLKPIWQSDTIKSARDGGWSSPVIANGKVYLYTHQRTRLNKLGKQKYPYLSPEKRKGMSDAEYKEYEVNRRNESEQRAKAFKFDEVVYCFNLKTGKSEWKNEVTSPYARFPQSGSPVVVDGKIYFLGAERHVRCLDVTHGKEIWKTRLPGDYRDEFYQSSVVVVDHMAIVMATNLFGLNIKTGDIQWKADEQKIRGSHASPALWESGEQDYLIVNLSRGKTACLNPKDGKEIWRVDSQAGVSSPTVIGDLLITYGTSRKRGMRCFEMSATSAKPLWTYHGTSDKGSSPVVVGDYIYVQGERRLACVNIKTGKAAWQTTLDLRRPQFTSLIAIDKTVIYANDGLLAFRANPEQFQSLINAKFDETGWLATREMFRKKYKLEDLEKQPKGLQKSERLYKKKIGNQAPLDCITPAFSNGYLLLRFKNRIACYDLRK